MITEHSDYREILKVELQRRCQDNPQYSQSAFARDLRILPSRLSEVLGAKQGLSARAARDISHRLGFSKPESDFFTDLVVSQHGRSQSARQTALLRLRRHQKSGLYQVLAEDHFRVIADWYHFAILELSKLKDFRSDYAWIAEALQISPNEVEDAVERLLRLYLMRRNGTEIELNAKNHFVSSDAPNESIRAFHLQMLTKAIKSLENDALEVRENQSYLVAIDERRLPAIRQSIVDWARGLDTDISQSSEPEDWTAVYCLSTHFFRLSQSSEEIMR